MAKERISIIPHSPGSDGFDIPFPNGTVTIPDTPGGYCISSGCGSGKTESIKSLIRLKHTEGILYCVDTIAECQKMNQWVHEELVSPGFISDADVIMINSKADIESMKTYQEHPEKICEVQILIVVQVRFFIELINLFVLYRPHIQPLAFDGDFKGLMTSGTLRRYILFDETPLFLKPFLSLTTGELAPFAHKSGSSWKCKSPTEIRDVYDRYIKGDRKMDYSHGTNRLCNMKNNTVLSLIPQKFDSWMSEKSKIHSIQFWPSDLIQTGMTSYLLIFEGAGDILLGGSSLFKLLDLPKKYNSTVDFHSFQFNLSRKTYPTTLEYETFVDSICNILNLCQGRTLIVIWKDFKGGSLTETADNTYTQKLTDALNSKGINPNSFAVTYYGASDSKSTNAYRDCQNIILCGRWGLGDGVIRNLEKGFGCQTACMENYMMWYYVQLLLRIGIRNNNGGHYHVYYSSDHKDPFICRLSVYLNQNILIPNKIRNGIPLWEALVLNYKMGKHYLPDLRALVGNNTYLKTAIETGQSYIYSISLKDISMIIPKKKKVQKDN